MPEGRALVPGSCGELVQGTIDGMDFLVSCPIDLYSEVTVRLDETEQLFCSEKKEKAVLAAQKTQAYLGIKKGGQIIVQSALPEAKGMASSTADISAACWAMADAVNQALSAQQVAQIALAIEPSDGVMFSGITLFDHRTGQARSCLGVAPPMGILILDLGGEVDTLLFNERVDLERLNREKERQVQEALFFIKKGLEKKDAQSLAQGSTLSALAHQSILPKPDLVSIIQEVKGLGALGVNIAHSGTVIGILAKMETYREDNFRHQIEKALGKQCLAVCQLIDGGRK